MNKYTRKIFLALVIMGLVACFYGCTTTKSKEDISGMGMLFQNMTAHYNGYFNATEIMKESLLTLDNSYEDNYNQILPVFPYNALDDIGSVDPEMDRVIEKSSVAISLHRPSKWTDDCYLMIGRAQFVKQDFESAQKTLEFMSNNFDPNAPKRKKKVKRSPKQSKKERAKAKKKRDKERKIKHKVRKKKVKEASNDRKAQEKAREAYNKQKRKEIKKRRKSKGKKKKTVQETTENPTRSKTTEATKTKPSKKDEKKDKDKKADKKDDKHGMFAHVPAYPKGKLWLARTYIERDFLTQAGRLFAEVEAHQPKDKELEKELYPALADFHIKTENYDAAIDALIKAIDHTGINKDRSRYAFIVGQLMMLRNRAKEAKSYFVKCAKWSTEYEMEFNADIFARLADFHGGEKTRQQTMNGFEKMVKDEKNKEYTDRIYFQMAKIYLQEGDELKAAEMLEKALENPNGSNTQKTEIYLSLGDIYFGKDIFDKAFENYSKAIGTLPKSDDRYYDIKKRKRDLEPIAANLAIITLQDSLLTLANLSDDELAERAKKILKEKKAEELAALEKGIDDRSKAPTFETRISSTRGSSAKYTSKFFAYDEKNLRKTQRNFQKTWDDRKLIDDWRRIKETNDITEEEENKIDELSSYEPTESEIRKVFSNVPNDSLSVIKSRKTIGDALYVLGVDFRNRLERRDLSDENFLELVNNYSEHEKLPEAYYYLFLNAKEAGDRSLAKSYAQTLSSKYPDTKYANLANDPDYREKMKSKKQGADYHYELAFEQFNQGKYAAVIAGFPVYKANFGNAHENVPRYHLLKAMSVGHSGTKEEYVVELRRVVAQYPRTESQSKAREIIRFLTGDENAFSKNWDPSTQSADFVEEFDKTHYLVVVVHNSDVVPMTKAKYSVSDYNKKYHKLTRLDVRDFVVDRTNQKSALLIRKFKDRTACLKYRDEVARRVAEFVPKNADVDMYAISQKNYREVIKVGSIDSYKPFHGLHYPEE